MIKEKTDVSSNAKEGMGRIAKLLSVVGWLILGGSILIAVANLFNRPDGFIIGATLFIGVLGWALLQGIVWIIDGFLGNVGIKSALLWPYKKKPRRTPATSNDAPVVTSPNLVGVRGWLLFFCLTLMVFSPLATLGETAKNIAEAERAIPGLTNVEAWSHYTLGAWAVAWLYSGLFAFAGYKLYNHFYRSSVSIAVRIIWLAPMLLMAADMWLGFYFLEITPARYIDVEYMTTMFRAVVYATVWTLYLKFSRRVRNTYQLTPRGSSRPPRQEPAL